MSEESVDPAISFIRAVLQLPGQQGVTYLVVMYCLCYSYVISRLAIALLKARVAFCKICL